jgi:hypothetical protein
MFLVPMPAARSGSPATAPVGDDAQPAATAPPAKMSFAQMMKSGPKPGVLPMTWMLINLSLFHRLMTHACDLQQRLTSYIALQRKV